MTFNQVPFEADTELGILEQIRSTELEMRKKRNISNGLHNLILRCLDKNPDTRIKMEELRKNKWINEGFTCSLDSKGNSYSNFVEAHFIENIKEDSSKCMPVHIILYVVSYFKTSF
jgi:serine/threonine protein kinase